ncbi:hypothetical protein [Streptomyces sp. NPDC048623]|uniref:hypothetical protein n=1 Tax=Streptomyces sp. NPDC048623 TaxID=3155761 RepID=UPI00341582F1
MSVTVNTVPAGADVAVRAGGFVVKRYRLVNRGEADLYEVGVSDPGVPGGRADCPRRTLNALASMVCTARFRAAPGRHLATARATGAIPSLGRQVTATARSGYEGVAGALALTEAVRVGRAAALSTVTVRYTITNRGNRPVHAVRLTDQALGAAPGGPVCAVPVLAPGVSAGCTATVRRGPGSYRSAGLAEGSDRVTTVGERGERLPAPLLSALSSAAFRVDAPASGPGTVGAGGAPGGAVVGGAAGVGGMRGTTASAGAAGAPGVPGVPAVAGSGALGAAAAAAGPASPATGALPSGAAPRPPAAASAVPAAPTAPAVQPPPDQRRATLATDDEGLLSRVHRRSRELPHLGVVLTLLLILIPAAIAAVLLGNRHS